MKTYDVVYFNGDYLPRQDFYVSIEDRSFQYGDGLFETMHACGKQVQYFTEHMIRLRKGLELLKITLSDTYSDAYMHGVIEGLLHRCRLYQGATVKLSVSRVGKGKYIADNSGFNLLIEASYLNEEHYVLNPKGLCIGACQTIKKPIHDLFTVKTKNSLIYILAGIEVVDRQWDDGILLNEQNYLVEATSSNLFLIKDNTLCTPSLATGCLHGIMRQNIISLASSVGMKVEEISDLTTQDLIDSNEIFLTNAVVGIRWVGAFQGKRYLNKTTRKLVQALNVKSF